MNYRCLVASCFQYQVVLMDFMKRKHKNNTRVFNCEIQFHDLFRRNSHYFHLIVRSLIYTLFRLTTMNTFLNFSRAPVAYS